MTLCVKILADRVCIDEVDSARQDLQWQVEFDVYGRVYSHSHYGGEFDHLIGRSKGRVMRHICTILVRSRYIDMKWEINKA